MVKIQGNVTAITEIVKETMITPNKIYSTVKLNCSRLVPAESRIPVSCETQTMI